MVNLMSDFIIKCVNCDWMELVDIKIDKNIKLGIPITRRYRCGHKGCESNLFAVIGNEVIKV